MRPALLVSFGLSLFASVALNAAPAAAQNDPVATVRVIDGRKVWVLRTIEVTGEVPTFAVTGRSAAAYVAPEPQVHFTHDVVASVRRAPF